MNLSRSAFWWRFNLVIAVLIGIVYTLSFYPGQDWGGDYSQYIHHAANLIEGKHYSDTGYIISDISEFVGPAAYPPVFPFLLAPVYAITGLDFEALKLVSLIPFCLALLLLPALFKAKVPFAYCSVIIVLVGANPFFWEYSNRVMSDFTFMLFTYLSLFLMQRNVDAQSGGNQTTKGATACNGLLLGITMYLAFGSREIGIVLPLCILTYDLIWRRRLSLLTIISWLTFATLAYAQHTLLQANFTPQPVQHNLAALAAQFSAPAASSHLAFINLDPASILDRILRYRWALNEFLPAQHNAFFSGLNTLLFNGAIVLGIAGFFIAMIRKVTVLEIFVGGYIAVLLIFGSPTYPRYLLPLVPLGIYYVFICIDAVFDRIHSPTLRNTALGTALALVFISYGNGIANQPFTNQDMGITHPDAQAMFEFVRNHTDPDDTIVFVKPRTMALLTNRQSIGLLRMPDPGPELINRFFDAAEADYLVDMNLNVWARPLTHSDLPSERFQRVFRNEFFAVYQYRHADE
ncbi:MULTISPECIES: hypothetical protein [unclassified Ketobacter]|uniref:hypothetical protein n=1 Tax=unclassified Ketobacter TaxID=2639109 RepID=UPI000F2D3ED4|nr:MULTISPECIES: hypothetical protein [unclassified Ketobacter]RLT87744.1 MAG: hypothetical protein D9N13_21955 [Ketobacter sp. GenoA1]RLT96591.1 MAG: hypothetical protein D9N15_10810 [Ketobacter sp.]